MEKFEEINWYPRLCYAALVAGVSGSGKSHFVHSVSYIKILSSTVMPLCLYVGVAALGCNISK